MKLNWNFLGDRGYKTKNLPWGSMDIFWDYTIVFFKDYISYPDVYLLVFDILVEIVIIDTNKICTNVGLFYIL